MGGGQSKREVMGERGRGGVGVGKLVSGERITGEMQRWSTWCISNAAKSYSLLLLTGHKAVEWTHRRLLPEIQTIQLMSEPQ